MIKSNTQWACILIITAIIGIVCSGFFIQSIMPNEPHAFLYGVLFSTLIFFAAIGYGWCIQRMKEQWDAFKVYKYYKHGGLGRSLAFTEAQGVAKASRELAQKHKEEACYSNEDVDLPVETKTVKRSSIKAAKLRAQPVNR